VSKQSVKRRITGSQPGLSSSMKAGQNRSRIIEQLQGVTHMANYDPNDPRRTDATDPHRPVDPAGRSTAVNETYVEPVEKNASPLPLIIGILLALALAWWLLSNFMGNDTDTAGDTTTTTTTVTTPAPDAAPETAP